MRKTWSLTSRKRDFALAATSGMCSGGSAGDCYCLLLIRRNTRYSVDTIFILEAALVSPSSRRMLPTGKGGSYGH